LHSFWHRANPERGQQQIRFLRQPRSYQVQI
jgi:hypothetical protein